MVITIAVLKSTHTSEQIASKPAQSKHKGVRFKPVILARVTGSIPGVDATDNFRMKTFLYYKKYNVTCMRHCEHVTSLLWLFKLEDAFHR